MSHDLFLTNSSAIFLFPLNFLIGQVKDELVYGMWLHVQKRGPPQSLYSSLSLGLGNFSYWLANFHLLC